MKRCLGIIAVFALLVSVLTLAACTPLEMTPYSSQDVYLSSSSIESQQSLATTTPCEACAEATLSALLTQEKSYSDAQAAATAAIMRANAQATLNASGATLSAALTQEQNDANVIAAEIAATAAIVRANAQATLVAAGSTQNAAMTQDAIRQTQMVELATVEAQATLNQQSKDDVAASTQTAVANYIATQTQSAVATSQWYADQERQREEERQGPLTFLWLWCPPLFIIAIALLGLLFFWRWMSIREAQQRLDMQPTDVVVIKPEPRPRTAFSMIQYPLAKPIDHVDRWLKEVERKLLATKKDNDDTEGS